MILSNNKIKNPLIFLAINLFSTIIHFSFVVNHLPFPAINLFLAIYILNFIISSLCCITVFTIQKFIKEKPFIFEIPVIICVIAVAAVTGMLLSHFTIAFIFGRPLYELDIVPFLFSIMISEYIMLTVIFYKKYKSAKNIIDNNLENGDSSSETGQRGKTLPIRENGKYHMVKYDDLIYVSSHGRKTTLHTQNRDYEINQLIKNIESLLSKNFIRIHKQFIINVDYLSRIEYYRGGRYLAYLNDDDESMLPIGKSITPLLKDRLGMKSAV